jgi:hypothetical protein
MAKTQNNTKSTIIFASIYELSATPPATVQLSADSSKLRHPTAHCSTFSSRTKPTHKAKLAKELQFCQRTNKHLL